RLTWQHVARARVAVCLCAFGISCRGQRSGGPYPHCYRRIIRRNTPLPRTRAESYASSYPYQTEVDIQVYQGDDEDALNNVLVGNFRVEGLVAIPEPNEVLCRMRLDLDGILEVTAVEQQNWKIQAPHDR